MREGADEIIHHPWFRNIDMDSYTRKEMTAPWQPPISSQTDVSNFDPYDIEDDGRDEVVDTSSWDHEF